MTELRHAAEKTEKTISDARELVTSRNWAGLSRAGFVNVASELTPRIEELLELFQIARAEVDKRKESPKPELGELCREINQLITLLKRNRDMEESRLEKLKSQSIHSMAETITVPALYSDLEQKTLSILLKATYAVERIRVFDRKREPLMHTKGAQKNILDLLEQRERELEDLRKKYEETRNRTFLGLVEKESSIETENELNAVSRSFAAKTGLMRKLFDSTKESFLGFQRNMAGLGEMVNAVDELESQLSAKTFEAITMLKKERDYAKKVLIEIEQDTIQLRNTYSKELLGLQEEKLELKNSLEEKYDKQLAELREEIKNRNELIRHFRETVAGKEAKIAKLEDENEKLALANKTIAKHSSIKEHFSRRTKKDKR